ncbi:acyltransferase [Algibacter lectus]|uniref:acyltransferase n=1 Tax=Algibacter lectus TaxID=221126 RepID=UPI002493E60A|nr:acyltransferase [Algibacter lectus]
MSTGREKTKRLSGLINILVYVNKLTPRYINTIFFLMFRNTSGHIGLLIRYVIFKNLSKSCGNNVSIHPGVFLKGIQNTSIGNNVSIHSMCYLDGTGGLTIRDNVSIAHASTIMTTNHTWNNQDIPIKYNDTTKGPVLINDDVWVGCGCRILANVSIGTRTIIAAGAVVNKNVENHALVGGIPAKLIKKI